MTDLNFSAASAMSDIVSLHDLDEQLQRVPHLSDDERSAIWLYAWASREVAARAAILAE